MVFEKLKYYEWYLFVVKLVIVEFKVRRVVGCKVIKFWF